MAIFRKNTTIFSAGSGISMVPELVEVVVVAAAVVAAAVGGVYCGARKVRTAIWGLRKKEYRSRLDFPGTFSNFFHNMYSSYLPFLIRR